MSITPTELIIYILWALIVAALTLASLNRRRY